MKIQDMNKNELIYKNLQIMTIQNKIRENQIKQYKIQLKNHKKIILLLFSQLKIYYNQN